MKGGPQEPVQLTDWDGYTPRCRWCGQEVTEGTLTIEQLLYTWCMGDEANRVADDGVPSNDLVFDCPSCARPNQLSLRKGLDGRHIAILAVRTKADLRLLGIA